jgi:hypothetical protein
METTSFPKAQPATAREMVQQLMDRGYTPQAIADLMGHRVSWRTIYRWAKGENSPHQPSDLEALRKVCETLIE